MESNDTDTDADRQQTTLLTFDTVEVEDGAAGEVSEAVRVDVESDDGGQSRELEQYESLAETPPLHERVMEMAEELGVDTRVIDLPKLKTLHTDENGRYYITDLNGVIRYYPESGVLETTDDYEDKELVADGTQRKNDLQEMYNTTWS